MSESPAPAVFLSYASQDVKAATRIAVALRGFGVEVWFDQNELRGGDAWDQKIKQHIKDCHLFLPLISANTQSRGEGYFRREWKLADERTYDMGRHRAFVIPICIDDTPDSNADVPDSFLRVQWTRLPHGTPSTDFVQRVVQLLQPRQPETMSPPPGRHPTDTAPTLTAKTKIPAWTYGAAAAVLIGVTVALMSALRPGLPRSTPDPVGPASPPPAAAAPTIDVKSIAVLPFTNMSDESDSVFFTDGIHEDVLTKLALIRDLHVVSRTSVMQYRGRTENIRQIAEELNVAYILEGSVRRAGNQIRVTGQLIRAASDEHVWANSYDRNLTDVFAIQSELATAIATALSTVLSPSEQQLVDLRPTDNVAAYDSFAKARQILQSGDQQNFNDLEPLLKSAVLLDPSFAQAWAELGSVYARRYFDYWERTDECLDKAKAAIDRAVALAPTDPTVIQKRGDYYYYGFRDYDRASAQYQQLATQYPNFAPAFGSLGFIHRRQGRWSDAMAELRRAVELEPRNLRYLTALTETAIALRLYDEAATVHRRTIQQDPDNPRQRMMSVALPFLSKGSTTEGRALMDEFLPVPKMQELVFRVALLLGDLETAVQLQKKWLQFTDPGKMSWSQRAIIAWGFWLHGDLTDPETLAKLTEEGRAEVARSPSTNRWSTLAQIHLMRGENSEALRCAQAAKDFLTESSDAWDGVRGSEVAAMILAWAGETDRALAEVARLLKTPNGLNANVLRTDCEWRILQGNPRFETLLDDPINHQPLLY